MSNEATVIVVKDADVFLLLIYSLGQLEFFISPLYLNTDSDQSINFKVT